ncbi:MAG: hypothetical protein Q8R78_06515 [Candidatus Omnitrophota bacterium]|nr:hypothetical protein [Candidatus Omnitrophota bacterium]
MMRVAANRPRVSRRSRCLHWFLLVAFALGGLLVGLPGSAGVDEEPAPAGGSTFVPSRTVDPETKAKAREEQQQLDRQQLNELIRKIIFAIMEEDGETLAGVGRSSGHFQSEVKDQARIFLSWYATRLIITSKIEPQEIDFTSETTAKAMMLVELTTVDASGGLGSGRRTDIWRFEKVWKTWYLLFD